MNDIRIKDKDSKWIKTDIDTSKIKRYVSKDLVYMTRKDIIQTLADDIWDKCPGCGNNTVYIIIHTGGLGDSIDIECPTCNHTKDASHVENW